MLRPSTPAQQVTATSMATQRRGHQGDGVDRFGALASSLCALHCVVSAFVPAVLGVMGAGFLLGEGAEWAFTGLAIGMAATGLVIGWRRHRSRLVAALFVGGILGLLASRGVEGLLHHDGEGTEAIEAGVRQADEHGDAAADGHEEGGADEQAGLEATHFAGTGIGVLAGVLLVAGHITNVRRARCCADEAGAARTGG
jgi:hypothetical protein